MLLDPELLKKTGVFSLALSELVVLVIGGYVVGKWLDQKINVGVGFQAALPLAGLGYSTWRIIRRYKDETK